MYIVPNYQRLYVWNREDQWDPLWSDVVDIAEDLIEEACGRNSGDVDPDSVESHFLGAVVLKMSGNTPDLARQLRVIDGQQRLTTLQLLMAAAVAELERAEIATSADRLRKLTANSSSSAASGIESYKINHHRYRQGDDYERFNDVMDAALNNAAADTIDGPMAECCQFFRRAIREWISLQDANINIVAAALTTTLILKLHVVAIYLDRHEKEHIIFETLNARGEPLTEYKIKNYLLYKADQEPNLNQESFFEKYLVHFDDPWWRQAVGRGAARRPRSDIFADYWLESRKKIPVVARRVFREFQKYVDDEDQHVETLMRELVRDAQYFRTYEQRDANDQSREGVFHSRRLAMGIGAMWPLLLQLQRIDANLPEREQWFATLESYFVHRMIAGYQARGYNRIALELLNALPTASANQSDIGESLLNHLLAYKETATLWPSEAEFKEAVLKRQHSRYAQRLVLSAIEVYLISDLAAVPALAPNVEIEHIMPQGWVRDTWPLPESEDQETALEKRNVAINTLGNLTLLNGRLNASISNSPWHRKRKAIKKSDNLFLNRRLLDDFGDVWTEEDIYRRGEWMYELVVEIWPRG